ncbi:hypothetical protein [Microbacterium sp. E-13]|uniref:hypothetical protein n=1 Tax=Microbacterium sp. E-13 TaxID=3404048 RepID=UPI003CF06B0F
MPLISPALSVKPTPIALLRSGEVSHPERAVGRDELIRVRRGVFAPAQEWRALDRPDFVWDDASVAGEADGDLKFDGRFGDAALLLNKQRTRDARLREQVRTIVHWGWQDVTAFTPLQTLLLGAGLRPTRPQNSAALLSMRQRLAARAPHPIDPRWPAPR